MKPEQERGELYMATDYVAAVKQSLDHALNEKGFSVNGEMGAHDIYVDVFVGELDKLNKRLEVLEGKQA